MAAPYGTGQVSAGVGKPIAAPNRREGQPSAGTGTPGASTAPLNSCKGQVSVELIIITAVMASLLLLMLMVNNSLQQSWGAQKQVLEATAAANQVAIAMNRAAAGGDGTTVSFMNTVSPDITSIQIFDKRTVRAYYSEGGYASAALVTNDTNVSGSVPINRQVIVSNNGNTINLISGPVAGPVGTACGGSGAACCASGTCNTGLVCSASTCVPCGAQGQLCCDAGACNPNLACLAGTCQCGGSGQVCCGGTACSATFACNSSTVICQACGASAGQLCCYNGTSAAYDNCSGGASIACNTSALPQPLCYAVSVCSVPSVSGVVLNSSSGTNTTSENLSVSFSSTACAGRSSYNVTDWRLNGASIALLNMPFNKNVSSATTGAVGDYSTYGNNGTLGGGTSAYAPTWTASGEAGGAYSFDGINDYISVPNGFTNTIKGSDTHTIELWVYPRAIANNPVLVDAVGLAAYGYFLEIGADSSHTFYWGAGGNYRTYTAGSAVSLNQWHHVAVVKTGAGDSGTLYYDGVAQASYSGTMASVPATASDLALGKYRNAGYELNGSLDEVRIYNRSLSAQQIAADYAAGLAGRSSNTLVSQELAAGNVWTAAVTTTDTFNDSATVLSNSLTIKSPACTIPSATLNSTLGTNTTSENLTVSFTPTCTPSYNVTDWRLNGASIAVLNMPFNKNVSSTTTGAVGDYSTYGNNGTLGGGTASYAPNWTSSGAAGGAYSFDGASDYISMGNPASGSLDMGTAPFTAEAWIKTNDVSQDTWYRRVFGKGFGWSLYAYTDGTLQVYVSSTASGSTSVAVNDNAWHHVAMVRVGSNVTIFVDGQARHSEINANWANNLNNSESFLIGALTSTGTTQGRWHGSIDDVKIYKRALSAQQIAADYAAGLAGKSANTLVSQELAVGNNWTAAVTATDTNNDSATALSNSVTIAGSGTSLSACANLSTPNTVYTLTKSVSINGSTCFNVTAANVTLNCAGYWATGNNSSSTSGIYSTQFNTTIKNCNTSNFQYGIYFNGAAYGSISNTSANTTYSSAYGIYLFSSSSNQITSSTSYSASGQAIILYAGANNNIITNTTAISSAAPGLHIYSGTNNTISNCTITSTSNSGIYLDSSPSNRFTNSTISSGSGSSVNMQFTSSYNNFTRNTFASGASQYTVDIEGTGSGNAFALNNFSTSTSSYYIYDAAGGNFYNATVNGINQGNIYPNVMNGSVVITGTAASSISGLYVGSAGSGYPYNNSTSGGKLSGAVVDSAPLTPTLASCTPTWTQRTSAGTRDWLGIAMSSNGAKLASGDYNNGYIWTSNDSGATWTQQTNSGTHQWARIAMSSDGTKIFAGAYSSAYTYYSNDSGVTWYARTMPQTANWYGVAMSSDGSKLIATVYASGYIYNSSDAGVSWSQMSSGSYSWLGAACDSDCSTILSGTYSGGNICTTANSGSTWTCTGPASVSWYSVASSSDGSKLAASPNGGYIYLSTTGGASWTLSGSNSGKWLSIGMSSDGTKLVTADYNSGYIYLSNDSGATWASQATPGTGPWYSAAASGDGTKFAVGYWGGYIWTYSCN